MPTIKIQKKLRVKPESYYLVEHAKDVTSQGGEDGVIDKIFSIMPPKHNYCVEFGAWDGVHLSNTWMLINLVGWQGLLLEGHEPKFRELQATYAANPKVTTLNRYVDFMDNRLDKLLRNVNAPIDFDFLSIDIDGNDWHIWDDLTEHRPRLVVVEFNPSVPNDIYFVQDRNPAINHGASLRALIDLGKTKGYELVAALGYNAFFVVKEEFYRFNIADNDIDAMYDCTTYESKLFQGYDGTLILTGCQELLWKAVPIAQEDIQVLPKAMRHYFEPLPTDPKGYTPAWRPAKR